MKVLQIIEFFTPRMGGSVQVAYQTARHLAQSGHQVTVCSSDYGYDDPPFTDTPFHIERFHSVMSRWGFYITPGLIPWAWKHLHEFDIIHLHNVRTFQNIVVGGLAKRKGIPYLISAHGSLPIMMERKTAKRLFDKLYGKRLIEGASRMVAVSEVEVEQYAEAGIPRSNIELIYNGLDLAEFSTLPEKGSFREKYQFPNDAKIILFVGRLHKRKGISYLIVAFSKTQSQFSKSYLVIAGPDDGELNILKELVKKLGLLDTVVFAGPLYESEKLTAFVDADVLVSPGVHEVFGLVPFEAIICGTPVIVTDDCGSGKLIQKATAGYLVRYGDVDNLQAAICQALSNINANFQMVRSGQVFINQNLDWNVILNQLEELYRDIKSLEN